MPWAERAELFIEGDKRVVRTGISEAHILEKHIRENQREFWVDNTKSPLRNPNGEIIGVIGSLEDITSRVEAEEARKASEEKFRILFEQSYDGIMLTRPDGVITDWNRSMEEITGRKAAEMVGQHIWDFHASSVTDPAQREMVANVVRHNYQLLETTGRMPNQNKTIEVNLLRTDGEIRQVLAINYCIEVGREKVVATLLRDITSEKQYQRVALESKKLAELGTLAAGIAHEINTPLQIINGLSERMLNRVQTKTLDRDRLIRELGNINDNGWRVANIVRSLLAYARASSGEFRYCSLNTVITDTLLLIEHQLKSWSNITVVTELNPDLPNLYCESNKISQLIINLLNNASDAMPEGGNITLRTTLKGKGFICISVRDEGTGIDPAIRDRIFDPFFTTKGVSAGTGLGLSFVLGVVKAHGGEIDVETSQGGGTTFNIRLPINPPAETPQTPENDIPDRYSDQLPIKS
jgi:PAS domain S-box-containing protein